MGGINVKLIELKNVICNQKVPVEVREYGRNYRFTGRSWGLDQVPAEIMEANVLAVVPMQEVLRIDVM